MIVFVHGVPETAAIWDKVRARVDRDSVALALPGFGCARPEGFGATMDEYRDWLSGELAGIGEPVDLVGHDWGALLVYGLVGTGRTDHLRSWAADCGNIAHPDYVWHPFAQIWQTEGEGEAFFEAQKDVPVKGVAAGYEAMGVPAEEALVMAGWSDETMAQCILDLYRSAAPSIHERWGPFRGRDVPGLVLCATDDAFSDEAQARQVAEELGAHVENLEGVGHFWPYQAPDEAAAVLERFWATLD